MEITLRAHAQDSNMVEWIIEQKTDGPFLKFTLLAVMHIGLLGAIGISREPLDDGKEITIKIEAIWP